MMTAGVGGTTRAELRAESTVSVVEFVPAKSWPVITQMN